MAGVFSEPTYVLPQPSTSVLSETRPTHLSPTALAALNYLLDELLHIVVHAALHSPPASTTPTNSPPSASGNSSSSPPPSSSSSSRSPSSTFPSPLSPTEVLTTDRLKSSLARILGPTSLAKECILEGELAVRELIRRGSPSLRGDGALKRSGMWGTPVMPGTSRLTAPGGKEGEGGEEGGEEVKEAERRKKEVGRQANEVFRALRAWVMQISGMGAACHSPSPNSLPEHLVALSPPKPPPTSVPPSPHLTFLLTLYVERLLSTLSLHLLHLCAAVSARQSASDVATVGDLEVAMMEDDLVWSWAQGMRVRRFIAEEGKREREAAKKGSPVLSSSEAGRNGLSRAGSLSAAPPSGNGWGRNGTGVNGHRKGSASLAVPSSSVSAASAASGSPPPSYTSGSIARKPSLGDVSVGGGAASSFARRSSVDSTRSALMYGGVGGGRKASLGLGISNSTSTPSLDGDAFDQLISGNKTIKLSSTPDRLRHFEQRDTRKRLPSSMSMPTIPAPSSSTSPPPVISSANGMTKSPSGRRLQARSPQQRDLLEEEEEEDTDESVLRGNSQQKRKESLMDLLNSPPPWAPAGDAPPLPSPSSSTNPSTSRRPSLRPGGRPIDDSDPLHPMSVAMRVQDSQASTATTDSQATSVLSSEATGGEEAHLNASPGARMRALKAKDERRDLASERQVNTDLMDFFASTPPTAPPPENPYLGAPSPPLSPKRSKGGLRGLVSRVTGSKKDDDSLARVETPISPKSGFSLPSPTRRTSNARSQSISGASIATSSSSVAAMTASGFAVPAARAAYQPPPGLGSPTQPPIRERRSTSISSSSTRSRHRQQSLPQSSSASLVPGRSDALPPQGILIKPKNASLASPSTTSLPPPIPTTPATPATAGSDTPTPSVISPPKRSSSLKRNRREREASAQSTASAAGSARSSATSSPVPPFPSSSQAPFTSTLHEPRESRDRESSAHSAFTTASSGTRRSLSLLGLGEAAETSAPPIVVVPSGLVGAGELASKGSVETLGAGEKSREEDGQEEEKAVEKAEGVAEKTTSGPPIQLGPPIELGEQREEQPAVEKESATLPTDNESAIPPSAPSSVEPQPPTLSPPLQPVSFRTGSTTPLHTPPTPPHSRSPNRFSTSSSPTLPVGGAAGGGRASPPLAAPRVARFSAPSPTSPSSSAGASLRAHSRSPNHLPPSPSPSANNTKRLSSSPLASPPLLLAPSPGTPTGTGGEKSLSTTLKELRAAMLYAETRDECVELVEALLRDYARRAEARAGRESAGGGGGGSERGTEEEGKMEGGQGKGDEEEQARLVEFFLSGGDLPWSGSSALVEGNGHFNGLPHHKLTTTSSSSFDPNPNPTDLILPPARSCLLIPTPEMRIPGGFDSVSTPQQASPVPPPSSSAVVEA